MGELLEMCGGIAGAFNDLDIEIGPLAIHKVLNSVRMGVIRL